MQRFRIDDHLQKRSKALQSLVQAGPAHFDQAQSYVRAHELYDDALRLYAGDAARLRTVYALYAEHLNGKAKHADAALGASVLIRYPTRPDLQQLTLWPALASKRSTPMWTTTIGRLALLSRWSHTRQPQEKPHSTWTAFPS